MPSLAELGKPSLNTFLQYRSGGSPGRIQTDDPNALAQILQYDPTAHFVDDWQENGGSSRHLVYDESKLPAFAGDFNRVANAGAHNTDLGTIKDKRRVQKDDVYGDWTTPDNIRKPQDAAWTRYAPIAVSLLAPMAGAALAGAGIGGAAGLTGAVTSGAAGGVLGGAAGATSVPSWVGQLLAKAPQYARQASNGNGFSLESLFGAALGAGGSALGVPSGVTSAGMSLARLAGRR